MMGGGPARSTVSALLAKKNCRMREREFLPNNSAAPVRAQHDDTTSSIGEVAWPTFMKTRKKPVAEFFLDFITRRPALTAPLDSAQPVCQVDVTGKFSCNCDRSRGASYLLLGDACAFIDPVFSSGVMLTTNGTFAGADATDVCPRQPDQAAMAFKRFGQVVKHGAGARAFSRFIHRITNPTMRDLFKSPRNVFRVKEALLSVLAGGIFGKTPVWRWLQVFKTIYHASPLANLKRAIHAWKRRRSNIRHLEDPDAVACR
jgi:hypothetical protein